MALLDFEKWVDNRRSDLVSFIKAGTDIVGVDVQAALFELANRHFGKHYGYTSSVLGIQTDSTVFVDGPQIVIPNAPAGTYRVSYSFRITNTKSGTDGECEIDVNTVPIRNVTQFGSAISFVTAFKGDIAHSGGDLTVTLKAKLINGSGLTIVDTIYLEAWRIN